MRQRRRRRRKHQPSHSAQRHPVDKRVGKTGGNFRLSIVEPTAIDPLQLAGVRGHPRHQEPLRHAHHVGLDGKSEPAGGRATATTPTAPTGRSNVKPNQKFSNGEPVDAESIKRGMTRAALGTAASDVAYHMAGIKGFDELQGSTANDPTKVDFTGVKANGTRLTIALKASRLRVPPEDGSAGVQPGAAGAGAARTPTTTTCRSATGRSRWPSRGSTTRASRSCATTQLHRRPEAAAGQGRADHQRRQRHELRVQGHPERRLRLRPDVPRTTSRLRRRSTTTATRQEPSSSSTSRSASTTCW